jgi:hypothetical protein
MYGEWFSSEASHIECISLHSASYEFYSVTEADKSSEELALFTRSSAFIVNNHLASAWIFYQF